ncbi:hypothetical protein [Gimesia aquarii]|uniref:Limiting CO2-inducible protein B/C beta carbonyic anhydrase domain-containing protein n=1 Tax=Gimesia aquarii TaxID=2527964 RepID=A0A517VUT3_9PLAN|nr:hypothetical protein [Gimesia aquarii]QDT96765.1 hypothetical protein V144x_22230 [Gimesia aquarii]
MSWDQIVHKHYPDALTCSQAVDENIKFLEDELGGDRTRTLLAKSRCADDLVSTRKTFSEYLSDPFQLGGLAGFPFTGRTGMTAYSHHIPDGGTAFILYGPHIGVTADGDIGKVLRPGQSRCTTACGALVGAVSILESGNSVESSNDDFQLPQIVKMLTSSRDRILAADSPIKEATQVSYEIIQDQVDQIIDATIKEFSCKQIVLLGSIRINTDAGFEDYMTIESRKHIDL